MNAQVKQLNLQRLLLKNINLTVIPKCYGKHKILQ